MDKYYFMGHWFPLKEVREKLSSVTKIPQGFVTSEEDVSRLIEYLVKERPARFSHFAKEMHTLRFPSSKR